MSAPRTAIWAVTACAFLGVAHPARAQDGTRGLSMAEQLFLAGKAYMQDEDYEKACQKFEASHDIDKTATGTLLNLALCHEKVNKPASAWAEFRQVMAESIGKREDRVKLAHEHEEKLLPLLSRLTVIVPPEANLDGLKVELDGRQSVPEALWGSEFPVDPGAHVVVVTAPGKKAARHEVAIGAESDHQTVTVAQLESLPVEKKSELGLYDADELASARARRAIGFTLGGVGLAAALAGGFFGIVAINENSDAKNACPGNRCESEEQRRSASDKLSDAKTDARVSNVLVGAGILMAAGGIVLVLTARTGKARSVEAPVKAALRGTSLRIAGSTLLVEGAW